MIIASLRGKHTKSRGSDLLLPTKSKKHEDLPLGWVRLESRSSPGSFYYAHPATRRTQIERPVEAMGAGVSRAPTDDYKMGSSKSATEKYRLTQEQAQPPKETEAETAARELLLQRARERRAQEAQLQRNAHEQALREAEAEEEAARENMLRRTRERKTQEKAPDNMEDLKGKSKRKREKKAWQHESDDSDDARVTQEDIDKWKAVEERREREEEETERKRKEEQERVAKREADYEAALAAARERTGEEQRRERDAALELARQMVAQRLESCKWMDAAAATTANDGGNGHDDEGLNFREETACSVAPSEQIPSSTTEFMQPEPSDGKNVDATRSITSNAMTMAQEAAASARSSEGSSVANDTAAGQLNEKRDSDDECCVLDVKVVASTQSKFGVGDRVRGMDTGKVGIVVSVDADGDPKVRHDGESEALQRFGKDYDVIVKASFGVGDRVRGKETGNLGVVVGVDADGDPKIKIDGEEQALQRFGREFTIVTKATFGVGDRVRGNDSGKVGTVVSVDAEGDPKVLLDGESEPLPRFGSEFTILLKAPEERVKNQKRSRSRKKKKRKKRSSSSSKSSSSSSRRRRDK